MIDGRIRVTTQELKRCAEEVKIKTSNLKSAVEETEKLISRTSSYWIGRGGDAKRKEFSRKKDMTNEVIGRLGEYTVDLLEMAGIYEETEATVAERNSTLSSDVIL